MSDVKEYVVTVDGNDWDKLFVVSAKNAKDAVNAVWYEYFSHRVDEDKEKGYRPTVKSELHARSVGSLHNEYGKVVCLD